MIDQEKLLECIFHCMNEAMKECPEESKNWTPEELFEKGAEWASRNIVITEKVPKTNQQTD